MGSGYWHDVADDLEAAARGLRGVEDVADPRLRAATRAALEHPGDAPGLDPTRRARIRRIVLAAVPAGPRPSDRAVACFTLLARPAPYVVRFLAAAILGVGLLAGATVAGADALPDDALYGMKLAAEQMRLALAVAPADRASVELSLAEHRLGEAERFAARGSESGALVATSAYAAHLASAAAEISQIEALAPRAAALLTQLESRLALQRSRAAETAQRLLADPQTALAGAVLGTIAAAPHGSGATALSRIADGAAQMSAHLSAVADERARPVDADEEDASHADAARGPAERPLLSPPAAPTAASRTQAATGRQELQAAPPRPTVDPAARIAAEKAKEAATRARLAAERAKTTPMPQPTKTPRR